MRRWLLQFRSAQLLLRHKTYWKARVTLILVIALSFCSSLILWLSPDQSRFVLRVSVNFPNAAAFAYSTFYASDEYFPALQVFLKTLADTEPAYPLIIGITDSIDVAKLEVTVAALFSSPYRIELWKPIKSPEHSKEHSRWSPNWTKLRLWQLEFDRVLYVDADVLFLKNLDEVFSHPILNGFCGALDWGRWTPISSRKMNGGVILLRPSQAVFHTLLRASKHVSKYRSEEAEQGLLNYFFQKNECRLPYTLDAQKTLSVSEPSLWNIDDIFILHYTGEKPWRSWSTRKYRERWVLPEVVVALEKVDSWDAHLYESLHSKWHEQYLKVLQPEVHLRLWQMYHSSSCWMSLNSGPMYDHIRLTGPLRRKSDLDATIFESRLDDSVFQKSFGEFAGMLALYNASFRLRERRFVGFLSWRWREKENWMEGASIDWTKVNFGDTQSVFYWYAIYMFDFYEGIEIQHPGMLHVFKTVFAEFDLPMLGPGHFCMSNYIILHVSLFESFMLFASDAVQRYLRFFPLDRPCPFETPPGEQDRCAGFFTERLIHVWAAMNGVKMVYAVDHPEWRKPYGIHAIRPAKTFLAERQSGLADGPQLVVHGSAVGGSLSAASFFPPLPTAAPNFVN